VALLSTHPAPRAQGGSSGVSLEPALHSLASLLLEIAKGHVVTKTDNDEIARDEFPSDVPPASSAISGAGSGSRGRINDHEAGGERAEQEVSL
jgi:hypothetical protein